MEMCALARTDLRQVKVADRHRIAEVVEHLEEPAVEQTRLGCSAGLGDQAVAER